MHPRIARRDDAFLLVVDVQEPLLKAMPDCSGLLDRIGILVESARVLGLPIVATEQYPERFGLTAAEVRDRWGGVEPLGKMVFSCCGSEELWAPIRRTQRRTAIVCGVEAHVCVSQTVHDLLEADYAVHVPVDAVDSRAALNREVALRKMRDSGAVITSVETVVYEMLREAGTAEFKALLPLFR